MIFMLGGQSIGQPCSGAEVGNLRSVNDFPLLFAAASARVGVL
jgi:hypothetical protein